MKKIKTHEEQVRISQAFELSLGGFALTDDQINEKFGDFTNGWSACLQARAEETVHRVVDRIKGIEPDSVDTYRIVSVAGFAGLADLTSCVNLYILEGWKPLGGVSLDKSCWVQAMVRQSIGGGPGGGGGGG